MDRTAFRRLVEEHKDRVYSYAVYMLRDAEEARDVAQESFVRLWQNRERVHGDGPARAWLHRTAHNLCIDRLRARSQRPEVDLERVAFSLPSGDADPHRRAAGREAVRAVANALERLTPRDRAMLILREVSGLPYDEIARVLDVPLGTVKGTLHRARERLRERLAEQGVEP